MELLAKQYNTIKNENNSNVSQIITTKQIQDVVVANSSIMRNKYSDAIKKIISLRIGGKYLRYDPAVCAILTQEYQNDNPRDSFIGAHMDFLGFLYMKKIIIMACLLKTVCSLACLIQLKI